MERCRENHLHGDDGFVANKLITEIIPPTTPVADRGHGELENEGANQNDGDIGAKPEGITMAQW